MVVVGEPPGGSACTGTGSCQKWRGGRLSGLDSHVLGRSCEIYIIYLAVAKKCALAAPAIFAKHPVRLHPDLLDLPRAHDTDDSAETAVALMCGHQSSSALRSAGPGASNVGCHCLFERRVSHHESFFLECPLLAPTLNKHSRGVNS